jgi:enoyl-CoA hydratase
MSSEASTEVHALQILYETPAPRVARISLDRPDTRNAQSFQMLHELNAAFTRASLDDEISVIILAGRGKDFSSGHDLSFAESNQKTFPPTSPWGQFGAEGAEGPYGKEKEFYFELTERWRNLPKPTIAQVQGRCIAGGNMLAWACDLIVASDDAQFLDNTPSMGIPGAEFFNHPYEMPIRKAKEWLFTSGWMTAAEAHRLGMVNQLAPREHLEGATLDLALKIAEQPLFTLKLLKELLNQAQDAAGRRQIHHMAFGMHHLAHSHFERLHGFPIAIDKLAPKIRDHLATLKAER